MYNIPPKETMAFIADLFKGFADPTRVHILTLLQQHYQLEYTNDLHGAHEEVQQILRSREQQAADLAQKNAALSEYILHSRLKNVYVDMEQPEQPEDSCAYILYIQVQYRETMRGYFSLTRAELEGRQQAQQILRFLQKYVPGCENARIKSTASYIGIRESRMVEGEYKLTVDELKALARFDDAIAVANYDIDIHNPEGAGTSHYYFGKGEWYEIPYRCLLPKDCQNLLESNPQHLAKLGLVFNAIDQIHDL